MLSKLSAAMRTPIAAASVALALASSAPAAIIVSEVMSTGSSNATYQADWFELTNTGGAAVNISGWKVDDSSASFASALALRGFASINPGQSVVFIESDATGATDPAVAASFISAWFGGTAPAGFALGYYGGSGIGLGSGGDAVNIYDGAGAVQANVSFGAGTVGKSFDNAAGLTGAISTLSAAGVNGAIAASGEVGSPGTIGAPVVPEPAAWLLASVAATAAWLTRRKA